MSKFNCSLWPNLQSNEGKAALERVNLMQLILIVFSLLGMFTDMHAALPLLHGQSTTLPNVSILISMDVN